MVAVCRRFIINAPKDDLEGGCRILFVVETAWWFYEDNFREKDPNSLPVYKLYSFADACAPPQFGRCVRSNVRQGRAVRHVV